MTEPNLPEPTPSESPRTSPLAQFLDKALASGVPHDSVVGMLTARGWREKEIYAALADHCVQTTGLEVPRSRAASTGARDAFLYLLIFSTLSIWTTELGSMAFELINRWLPDPLYTPWNGGIDFFSWSLAAMLIAFPIYLFASNVVAREAAADPGRLESPIRKWLTYIALLLAALVSVSDLICALAFLIRGEITTRFVAKALVVLILSGGVYLHYYAGMSKSDAPTAPDGQVRRSFRSRAMAALALLAVMAMATLGFLQLGPPRAQRQLRADNQRIQHIYQLSSYIEGRWKSDNAKLPSNLSQYPNGLPVDPVTQDDYLYIPTETSHYRLCATFDRPSPVNPNSRQPDRWQHPAGQFCFQLDATQPTNFPNTTFEP